jgi:hypothetical protein
MTLDSRVETANQIRGEVKDLYANWDGARSSSVARHSVMSSTAVAQHSAATESGVILEKEWLSMQDAKVRSAHAAADGQTIGSEQAYIVDGEQLQFPRDPAGSPSNTANCRCQELFSPVNTNVTPEQVSDAADDILADAELRKDAVNAQMRSTAEKIGARQEGLEFQVKGKGSLSRKITDNVRSGGPGMDAVTAAGKIQDGLRYTMVLEDANYAAGMKTALRDLKAAGITPNKTKLYWKKGNNYMGGNYTFDLPDGFTFELQFHTPTSFAIKEPLLHDLYEQWRVLNPETLLAKTLDAKMRTIAAEIPFPPGLDSIPGIIKGN